MLPDGKVAGYSAMSMNCDTLKDHSRRPGTFPERPVRPIPSPSNRADSPMRTSSLGLLAALVLIPSGLLPAQSTTNPGRPERAIERDIPMTNMIRRAFAAGTRDSTGLPGPNYWQFRVDYDIDASLDPESAVLTGRERVTLHNDSPDELTSIVLRLDQNIFAANVPRAETVTEITEGIEITRLALNGTTVDLKAVPARRGRGAGPGGAGPAQTTVSGLDLTVARINLATPIPAKSRATLEIDWHFRVPRADNVRGLRMGRWADTLYQVAQWYPRVAKYDDLRGWDTDPYLGPSEFYNNFGRFDVRLEVPGGWLVGATGVLQNPGEVLTPDARQRLTHVLEADTTLNIVPAGQTGAGKATMAAPKLTWHFVADTVGDFAFATSNRFVYDASRATIPGRGAIPIHILYLPGNAQRYAAAGATVRHALEFYSRMWMPYAFPQMSIVDGPEGGMEYPMFIMSSVGAADHETGHQWWPMMVGVNETWYGWMDEGFNTWQNSLSRQDRQGQPLNTDGQGQRYGSTSGDEREAPLMWDANYGGPMYSFQAYSKAPMMLSMLGGVVGDSAVFRAHSEWARAWAFRHPSPWDYMFFMSRALQRDLGWFWYSWLFSTDAVQARIDTVTETPRLTQVHVRQDGEMPSPVVLKVVFAKSGPAIRPMSNARMVDDTTAIVTWPVDVWFSGSRSFRADLAFGPRTIERIVLDPGCRFPDRDLADNVWPRNAAPQPEPGARAGRGGAPGGASACPG